MRAVWIGSCLGSGGTSRAAMYARVNAPASLSSPAHADFWSASHRIASRCTTAWISALLEGKW